MNYTHQGYSPNHQHIKIFTDLNCPFCFVQNERTYREQLQDNVQWCYVEHAPELNSQTMSLEQADLLDHDYQRIIKRSKDVNLHHPGACTNTRLAILSLITVEQIDQVKANLYRQLLYRAYWQNNRDISDPQVLHELLNEIGMAPLHISDEALRIQQEWQSDWENGDFDRRIPAMQTAENKTLLGLQSSDDIRHFILGEETQDPRSGDACFYHGDFQVAVLGIQTLADDLLEQANGVHAVYFTHLENLLTHCLNYPMDAVILDYHFDMQHGYRCIRELKEQLNTNLEFPLIYVSETGQVGEEVHAFTLGANDFIHIKSDISPVIARLKNNLNQSRTVSILHRYATVDGLTGLLNKREFMLMLEHEWRHASRNGLSLSLIMVDIDHFKNYNDTHGHCSGDEILRQIALCLRKQLYRPKDIIARFGGEEFIVLLPDTDFQGTEQVCQQLLESIQQLDIPHPSSPIAKHITISLGGCCSRPNDILTAKQIIELADNELYKSKDNGRNQYSIGNLTRLNS